MKNFTTTCPVCRADDAISAAVSHTFIGHKDFLPMKRAPSKLSQCNRCQTIYINGKNIFSEIEDIYHGEAYAKEKKTEHVVFEQKGTVSTSLRTTYSCFAELIRKQIDTTTRKAPLKFLDIGCFDGKLLVELKKDYPDATMHGFDVSDHVGAIFPKVADFAFYTGTLDNIQWKYDAVLVVNVLAYIPDLPAFAEQINRLLSPGGFVVFVCADARKNPYFLTCGDQYTFQTLVNLKNFWAHFGYSVELIDAEISFPRNILGFARRDAARSGVSYEKDDTLLVSLSYLACAATELQQAIVSHQNHYPAGRIAVLGCSQNAAWAHNLMGAQISCFADENLNRVGRSFYGKTVVHPGQLTEEDLLLLPYGTTAKALAEKFGKLYKAKVCAL